MCCAAECKAKLQLIVCCCYGNHVYRIWVGGVNSEECLVSEMLFPIFRNIHCLDTNDCSYYAEGGRRKCSDPVQYINVNEAVMKCNIYQL